MRRRWLILLLFPLFLLGGLVWLAGREWTLQWVAQKLVKSSNGEIRIEGVSGTLLGSLEVESLVIDTPEKDIRIDGLQLEWRPWKLIQGQLDISLVSADNIEVDLKQSSDEPFVMPQSLAPPVPIRVAQASFENVTLSKSGVGVSLRNVHFSLVSDAAAWRLEDSGFDSPFGRAVINMRLETAYPCKIDGTIRFDNELVSANADIRITGDLNKLGLSGYLDGYGAKARLEASLVPFAPFPVESILLDAKGLDPSRIGAGWPVADIDAQIGVFSHEDKRLKGRIAVHNGKPGSPGQNEIPLRMLKGNIGGEVDNILLNDILLDFGKAGQLTGNGRFASGKADLSLVMSRFDLHEISPDFHTTRISGKIGFHQSGNIQNLTIALGEDNIHLDARLLRKGDELLLDEMALRANRSELRMKGQMDLTERHAFKVVADVKRFNFAAFGKFPESDLNASLEVSGSLKPEMDILARYSFLSGSLFNQALSGKGQFHLQNREINDVDIRVMLGANSVSASGRLGKSGDGLAWILKVPDLASFGKEYKGTLYGEGELTGSLDSMKGVMMLDGTDFMVPGRYGAKKLKANMRFGTELQDRIAVDVLLDGVAAGKKTWETIQANIDGTVQSHVIRAMAKNDSFDLTAKATGGLTSRKVWEGKLDQLENRGSLAFSLDSSVPVKIGSSEISLRDMKLKLPDGQLTVNKLVKKEGKLETSGNARGVPLTYLLAVSPDSGIAVHSTLKLGADWSLATGNRLDGKVHLFREQGDIALLGENSIELGLDKIDMQAVFSGNTVNVDMQVESEKAGNVHASAMTKLVLRDRKWNVSKESPFRLMVAADMPSIAWIGRLTGQDVELGGAVTLRVNGSGTLGNPGLTGQLDGKDLAINWLDMGVNLSRGELSAVLEGSRMRILRGMVYGPEGSLRIGGGIGLKNGQVLTDLHFETDKLLLLSNTDRQLAVTGKGNFSLDENRLQLTGDWHVNRAMIILSDNRNVTYSKDVVVLGRPDKQNDNPVPVRFNVKIGLGDEFRLKGKGIDTRLEGQIQAMSEQDNRLRVFGTVNAVDGSYSAFGQKLTIRKGQVMFSGPVENPTIDILAVREFSSMEDVSEVGVSVKGTAQSPKVKLVSTPEVSDTEKLSWLILGYGGGENGDDQQRALVAAAAAAILSSEQSGGLPTKLASTIGLDDIGIASSSQLDETVLSLTKRISSRLYLSYEQGLTGATSLIKLRYIISKRLSLVGQTGTLTAVDLLYDWKFD